MKTRVKKFTVYVVADDNHCCAKMTFEAFSARLSNKNTALTVDGAYTFVNYDGFRDLEEVKE